MMNTDLETIGLGVENDASSSAQYYRCEGCPKALTVKIGPGYSWDDGTKAATEQGWRRRMFAENVNPWFCSEDCSKYSNQAIEWEDYWAKNNNEIEPFPFCDPYFVSSIYPEVEKKLGRRLIPEENQRIYKLNSVRKEWFFDRMDKCGSYAGAELFLEELRLLVKNQEKEWKGLWKSIEQKPKPPSLWKRMLTFFISGEQL